MGVLWHSAATVPGRQVCMRRRPPAALLMFSCHLPCPALPSPPEPLRVQVRGQPLCDGPAVGRRGRGGGRSRERAGTRVPPDLPGPRRPPPRRPHAAAGGAGRARCQGTARTEQGRWVCGVEGSERRRSAGLRWGRRSRVSCCPPLCCHPPAVTICPWDDDPAAALQLPSRRPAWPLACLRLGGLPATLSALLCARLPPRCPAEERRCLSEYRVIKSRFGSSRCALCGEVRGGDMFPVVALCKALTASNRAVSVYARLCGARQGGRRAAMGRSAFQC